MRRAVALVVCLALVVMSLPTLTVPVAAQQALPTALVGHWEGPVVQFNPDAQYPVIVDLTGGAAGSVVGTVSYPTYGCGGDLSLRSVSADERQFEFVEHITYGAGTCSYADAVVTLSWQAGDSLTFGWSHPDWGGSLSGALTRAGGAAPSDQAQSSETSDPAGDATGAQPQAVSLAEAFAAEGIISLAGPLSGELVQTEGSFASKGAGVLVEDFAATATIINPAAPVRVPWDVGLAFRGDASTSQTFLLTSQGNWHYWTVPEGNVRAGQVSTLNAAPGGANTLELIVEGNTALFGVNGEVVASVELLRAGRADVSVFAGFFSGNVEDRVFGYTDFEVWPFGPEVFEAALDADTAAPPPIAEPTDGAAPQVIAEPDAAFAEPAVPATDGERFAALLTAQDQLPPLAGPFAANLKESSTNIDFAFANVDLTDFHASAVVTVPAAPSDVPWDAGFRFRVPQGDYRVTVTSLGVWYFSLGVAAPATSKPLSNLVTTPGSTNALDLFVAGERAWLGVNGELVASIDLPPGSAAGDVELGAGLFLGEIVDGRVTSFRDFVVRPLDPDALTALAVPAGLPAAFAGQWQGTADWDTATMPVAMDLSGGNVGDVVGSIAYALYGSTGPTCGGDVALQSIAADGRQIELVGVIAYDPTVCLIDATVTISLQTDGTFSYDWRHPLLNVTGNGTLARTSPTN